MVADRDGRNLDDPATRSNTLETRVRNVPFFGIEPVILDEEGNEVEGNPATGYLCIKTAWPGIMRTVYGDHERFLDTYFRRFPGYYMTGDGVLRDEDGYYWITGRVDDVLNVSGHRLEPPKLKGQSGNMGRSPKQPSWVTRTTSKGKVSMPTSR